MFADIERAEADYYAEMEYVYDEGISKGRQQGIQQGIFTVARNMKQTGMSIQAICQVTGLSAAEEGVI